MKITYDPVGDAMYIKMLEGHKITRTDPISDTVNVDKDANGEIIGIEILFVRQTGIDPNVLVTQPGSVEIPGKP